MIRVGERLAAVRRKKGLTIEEVAKATKIRASFLTAIEKGDYKALPSSAYIQGFIRNYAEFLDLPVKETVMLFKREFDEREYVKVLPESFTYRKSRLFPGFRFGLPSIFIIFGILFILLFVLFQYKAAFLSPTITITQPPEDAVISGQSVTVVGKTDPNTTLTINDLPVYTDKDGSFKKDITVFAGANTITAKAVNNFGRQTTLIRHIIINNP